jgi:hypothetical protein
VGDVVLLKLQPYAQSSMVNRPCPKIAYKFYGSYTILEKVGAATYKLDLPEGSLIHPMFHILQLKEFTPDYKPVFFESQVQVNFSKEMLQPEAIPERRLVKKGNTVIPQVCVK